ncbi:PREDICTED: uncharacterized protein LOC106814228 [Priapulus caudatus]|uniref:Uncharacterized protein LOC106814228 n=1 Tax=Priapulus caudatus TaxID=37621 RepID=A0ABM1EP91_PRICU|nr:PREDICTED: uncharacterized protein LOC106814228 [Priapulus caudatus]
MIKEVDLDGDGKIDYEEFVAAMCSPARDVIEEEDEDELDEEEDEATTTTPGGLTAQYGSTQNTATKATATGNSSKGCGNVGSHVTVTSSTRTNKKCMKSAE